jgi:hypothetical protein
VSLHTIKCDSNSKPVYPQVGFVIFLLIEYPYTTLSSPAGRRLSTHAHRVRDLFHSGYCDKTRAPHGSPHQGLLCLSLISVWSDSRRHRLPPTRPAVLPQPGSQRLRRHAVLQTALPCSSHSTCATRAACMHPAASLPPVRPQPALPISAPASVRPRGGGPVPAPRPPIHPPSAPARYPFLFHAPPDPPIPAQSTSQSSPPPTTLHSPHTPCSPHLCPSPPANIPSYLCARLYTFAESHTFRIKPVQPPRPTDNITSVPPYATHTRHLSSRRPATVHHRPLFSRIVPGRLYPSCPASPSRNTAGRRACRR